MPRFSYLARDGGGTATTGELVAGSPAEAARLLRTEGKFLVRLQEASRGTEPAARPGPRRVRKDEIIYFAGQLAGMVETGVPIADALEASIDGTPPGAFRTTVEDLIRRVQGGADFSSALAAHPRVFSPFFVHLIRASESTGLLGTMLRRVADYLVNQRDVRKRIRGAMIYPCCLLVFALGAVVFLLSFVVPKFAAIYAGRQAVLPLPTRILLGLSGWMAAHWAGLLIAALVLSTATVLLLRTSHGRRAADWLRLNLPVVGGMGRLACLTRALRTLGAMIGAGVSVLDAVTITRDVVGNRLYADIFERAHRRLQQGEQLSATLVGTPYIPRPVRQMLHAGERGGQLGPVLDRAADLCESDLQHAIRTTTQFIEPAMITLLGIIVGGIALAVLMPVFQMSRILGH